MCPQSDIRGWAACATWRNEEPVDVLKFDAMK
jgi:hypothetical protein